MPRKLLFSRRINGTVVCKSEGEAGDEETEAFFKNGRWHPSSRAMSEAALAYIAEKASASGVFEQPADA